MFNCLYVTKNYKANNTGIYYVHSMQGFFYSLDPGKFFMLFCLLLILFQINFLDKFFQDYHLSVKQIGSRSGPNFVRPDLGPICLQRLRAEDTRRQRVNHGVYI